MRKQTEYTPELFEEMRLHLIFSNEAMRATEVFLCATGFYEGSKELGEIIKANDELLDRIDEVNEEQEN